MGCTASTGRKTKPAEGPPARGAAADPKPPEDQTPRNSLSQQEVPVLTKRNTLDSPTPSQSPSESSQSSLLFAEFPETEQPRIIKEAPWSSAAELVLEDTPEEDAEGKEPPELRRMRSKLSLGFASSMKERRLHIHEWLTQPPPKDPDMMVLRMAAAVTSGSVEQLRLIVDDGSAMLNELSMEMLPLKMNVAVTALSMAVSILSSISEGSNGSVPEGEQLKNCLKLEEIWSTIIQQDYVRTVPHPRLGVVPVVQPLIHSCIHWRLSGAEEAIGPGSMFDFALSHGARVDVTDSMGITTLHTLIDAVSRLPSQSSKQLDRAIAIAQRLIVEEGLSPSETVPNFNGRKTAALAQSPGLIGVVGRATEPFNAYEAMKLAETKGNAEALQSMQKVSRDAVGLREVFDEVMAHVCQSDNAPRTVVGDRLEAVSPHQLRERPRGPRPPVQAALNALWATTQLAGMRNPLDRRRLFCDLKGRSLQFSIPPMRVIPSSSVRELSGKEYNARGLVDISELPPDSVVAYVSMLHTANDTVMEPARTEQLADVAEAIASDVGGVGRLYVWSPSCCLAKEDSLAGMQLLSVYIACCDGFAFVGSAETEEDAWCRVERFLHWRLRCQPNAMRWEGGKLEQEKSCPPVDPLLGRLHDNAGRADVAMATVIYQRPKQ